MYSIGMPTITLRCQKSEVFQQNLTYWKRNEFKSILSVIFHFFNAFIINRLNNKTPKNKMAFNLDYKKIKQ